MPCSTPEQILEIDGALERGTFGAVLPIECSNERPEVIVASVCYASLYDGSPADRRMLGSMLEYGISDGHARPAYWTAA